MALEVINFVNGIASVKEGQTVDVSKLRQTRVYAKLMLEKGTKLVDKKFQYSDSGEYIRATAFVVGKDNQIIDVDKLFVSIDPKESKLHRNDTMYYIELMHPQFDKGVEEDF